MREKVRRPRGGKADFLFYSIRAVVQHYNSSIRFSKKGAKNGNRIIRGRFVLSVGQIAIQNISFSRCGSQHCYSSAFWLHLFNRSHALFRLQRNAFHALHLHRPFQGRCLPWLPTGFRSCKAFKAFPFMSMLSKGFL